MHVRISQAELEIMDVFWEADRELVATAIMAKIQNTKSWSEATVKTLLRRLVDKGFLTHRPDGRRFLYKPTISRAAYAETETNRLIDRLFGGKLSNMITQMADSRGLSDSEIKDLERFIKSQEVDE